MQRAAIKKQLFLVDFQVVRPLNAVSYANVSVQLSSGLRSPLVASDKTVRVYFEFNSTAPLVFGQQAQALPRGTQLVEVRHIHTADDD